MSAATAEDIAVIKSELTTLAGKVADLSVQVAAHAADSRGSTRAQEETNKLLRELLDVQSRDTERVEASVTGVRASLLERLDVERQATAARFNQIDARLDNAFPRIEALERADATQDGERHVRSSVTAWAVGIASAVAGGSLTAAVIALGGHL